MFLAVTLKCVSAGNLNTGREGQRCQCDTVVGYWRCQFGCTDDREKLIRVGGEMDKHRVGGAKR